MKKPYPSLLLHQVPAYISAQNTGYFFESAVNIARQFLAVIATALGAEDESDSFIINLRHRRTWRRCLGGVSNEDIISAMTDDDSFLFQFLTQQLGVPANFHLDRAINSGGSFGDNRDDILDLIEAASGEAKQLLELSLMELDVFQSIFDFLDSRVDFNFPDLGRYFNISTNQLRLSFRGGINYVIAKTNTPGLRIRLSSITFPDVEVDENTALIWGGNVTVQGRRIVGPRFSLNLQRPSRLSGTADPISPEDSLNAWPGHNFRRHKWNVSVTSNKMRELRAPFEIPSLAKPFLEPIIDEAVRAGFQAVTDILNEVLPEQIFSSIAPQSIAVSPPLETLDVDVSPRDNWRYSGAGAYKQGNRTIVNGRRALPNTDEVPDLTPVPPDDLGQHNKTNLKSRRSAARRTKTGLKFPEKRNTLTDVMNDVFSLQNVFRPDFQPMSSSAHDPGRVQLGTNCVLPSQFLRNLNRQGALNTQVDIGNGRSMSVQRIGNIAYDFSGVSPITKPGKPFTDKPALAVSDFEAVVSLQGQEHNVRLSARIEMGPSYRNPGPFPDSAIPYILDEKAAIEAAYGASFSLADCIEDLFYRNFVFINHVSTRPPVHIYSQAENGFAQVEDSIEAFMQVWARELPAIPLMIDPWFRNQPKRSLEGIMPPNPIDSDSVIVEGGWIFLQRRFTLKDVFT